MRAKVRDEDFPCLLCDCDLSFCEKAFESGRMRFLLKKMMKEFKGVKFQSEIRGSICRIPHFFQYPTGGIICLAEICSRAICFRTPAVIRLQSGQVDAERIQYLRTGSR